MSHDQNHTNAFLEDISGDIKTIFEQVVVPMRHELNEVKKAVTDIPEIEQDIQSIKKALTETNQQIADQDIRINPPDSQAK